MLPRNKYPQDYIDACRSRVNNDIATFKKFMTNVTKSSTDPSFVMAAESLEHAYFNNLLIALEGYFVHRGRAIEMRDGNPMNEVRVISSSLMLNGGLMGTDKTIKMKPENTVLKIGVGEKIQLTQKDFQKLSDAFFADLQAKFT